MERYRGDVPLTFENDSCAPATSLNYSDDDDCETNCDNTDLNLSSKALEHTLKRSFSEIQEVCRCANLVDPSSSKSIDDFAFWRVFPSLAGEVPSYDSFRRSAKVSDSQIKCDRLTAPLSSLTSKCVTWRSLKLVKGDDIYQPPNFFRYVQRLAIIT